MCIDFRGLNAVTKKDVYPLPRIDDILDTLNGMKFFSVLDQANAYWSILIAPDDREKTAFSTPVGLYHFKFLPFGLCNALSSFERLMELLLSGLQWKICLIYLDDILVFAKNFEEMLERLQFVFSKLQHGGMKLRLNKCNFCSTEVKYLGHVISAKGISPDPPKIEAIKSMPTPQKTRDVK